MTHILKMSSGVLLLLVVLSWRCVRFAVAQTTDITSCYPDSDEPWEYNLEDQNPCLIYAYALSPCYPGVDIGPLQSPDDTYSEPSGQDPCGCSTVTYSLMAACSYCQWGGDSFESWSDYSVNCASTDITTYSPTIPNGTGFPAWAYLDVTVQDEFSPTDADNTYNSGASESTPPGPSSTSGVVTSTATSMTGGSSSSSSPTGASGESPGKKANTAAIAGGTVGGFVLVSALAGLVACWLARRRKSDGTREPLDGPGQQENTYVETPSNAYWPPVSYERDSFYGNSNASDSYIATPDSRDASSAAATTRHSVISGPPPEHSSASSDSSWGASPASPTLVQYSPAPSAFGPYSGVPEAL